MNKLLQVAFLLVAVAIYVHAEDVKTPVQAAGENVLHGVEHGHGVGVEPEVGAEHKGTRDARFFGYYPYYYPYSYYGYPGYYGYYGRK